MTWPADVVLAVTVLEALGLLALRRRLGMEAADIAWMLLPGAALLVALHAALAGTGEALVALMLAGAGVAHLVDLRRRVRRGKARGSTPGPRWGQAPPDPHP